MCSFKPLADKQDADVIDVCKYCGGEIYASDPIYESEVGRIHEECMESYLLEKFGVERLAYLCDWEKA